MWACEEPEGYELIRFTGSISTLELDEDVEPPWEIERLPFGFQAPAPQALPVDMPELSSADWGAWLGIVKPAGPSHKKVL